MSTGAELLILLEWRGIEKRCSGKVVSQLELQKKI